MHLDVVSLSTLRSVSRDIELHAWVRYINSVRSNLEPASIQKVLAISRADHLRRHVHRLYIFNEDNDNSDWYGIGLQWPRNQQGRRIQGESNDSFKQLQTALCS